MQLLSYIIKSSKTGLNLLFAELSFVRHPKGIDDIHKDNRQTMLRWFGIALLLLLSACDSLNDAPPPTVAQPIELFTLEPWVTASGSLNATQNRNEWQFFGRVGEMVRLRLISQNDAVLMTVRLRNQILGEGTTVELTLPENEVYRVTVALETGESATYDIGLSYVGEENPNVAPTIAQVVGVPTPTPAYANLGEFITQFTNTTATGSLLTGDSPEHVYTFQGAADEIITVEMNRVAGTLDPTLFLYAPDGQLLAMDDNSGGDSNARLLNIRLPEEGLYSIQAQGEGLFGDYTLRFIRGEIAANLDFQPTAEPTTITPYVLATVGPALPDQRLEDHVPVIGNIARVGDFQRFSFIANAGDVLTISIRPYQNSTLRPQFEFFGADGNLLTTNNASFSAAGGAAFAAGVSIIESGSHILLITGEENTTGAFLVSIGKGTSTYDVFQGEVIANQQATATIQGRGERHIWRINLNPGDVITAAASPTGTSFDPVMELVTADGTVLYRDDNSGANNAALINIGNITEPSSYVLRVFDARGDTQGSYILLWRYVSIAATPTPLPSKTTILAVDDAVEEGDYQFYFFQGRAGQQVEISVIAAPDSALDPVAALIAPDGEVIAQDDDSNGLNPFFTVTLPEDGTYSVRVNGYLSGGNFDLFVALLF
jgi:hypothetical protein